MLRLRLFGAIELRAADGHEISAVLRQPKRLALLAYLVAAYPRRFHRRDSLLALFWPELDASDARRALRRALYFLRAQLGDSTIVARGDEVTVPREVVWCDVAAYREALEANRPEEAVVLYRGDLLEGFFVSSAPGFERWMEEERARLRTLAVTAAAALADRASQGGELEQAVGWARRAMELAPTDEAALRRLVKLLDRLGDRAAALEAYDAFTEILTAELDLEPSPETRALVDAIRARQKPSAETRAEAQSPRRPLSSDVIAVFPFAVRGDESFNYLREGMVDLLSTKLDRAGDVRTVDPHALLRRLQSPVVTPADPTTARVVAEQFGAGAFLLGNVVVAGGRLHVAATLYWTAGEGEVRVDVEVDGEAEIFSMVDDLVRQVLARRTTSLGGRLGRLAALTTNSLPALKAHLVGERAFRSGRYVDAAASFEQAVARDPGFALGHYRLAASYAACAMPEAAREPNSRAWQLRRRLNRHTRNLLEAQRAWLRGAAADAETLYQHIVTHDPDDVEAWFLLGDVQFHSNPYRGRSVTEARGALERTLALDPKHVGALAHLIKVAALDRRHEELESLTRRFLEVCPTADRALSVRGIWAFARDDRAAQQEVTADLRVAPPVSIAAALVDIALYAGNLAAAEHLGRDLAPLAPAPELRALVHLGLAHFAVARGDEAGAMGELEIVDRTDRAAATVHRGWFQTLPFVEPRRDALQATRDGLTAWDPPSEASTQPGTSVLRAHDGVEHLLRSYLLGLVCARLGNHEAALALADECTNRPTPSGATNLASNLAQGVRARVAQLEGEPARALELLDSVAPTAWFQRAAVSPFWALAGERFLRAEALIALGRGGEATGWLQGLGQRSPYELVYRRPAAAWLDEIASGRHIPAN